MSVNLYLVSASCQRARTLFGGIREGYKKLAEKIPEDQYYRYHDHWRFVTQRTAFLASLTIFLESGELASRETVAEMMGGRFVVMQRLVSVQPSQLSTPLRHTPLPQRGSTA